MKIVLKKIDGYSLNLKNSPTYAQWQAICITGCDVLVAAAAGSGKTAVLSERISKRIADDKWNIDRLLILTFTTSAAKSMRDKIEEKITQRLLNYNTKEDLEHLKNQRLLINNAQISTIDSFCLNVLKKFYYLVEEEIKGEKYYLSPDFKVLSNNKFILNESINFVIENFSKSNSKLLDVAFDIFKTKSDIINFVKKLYINVLSIPNYKDYIKKELTKNSNILLGNINYAEEFKNILIVNNENIYILYPKIIAELEKYIYYLNNKENNNDLLKKIIFNENSNSLSKFSNIISEIEENFSIISTNELIEICQDILLNIKEFASTQNNSYIVNSFNNILKIRELLETYKKLQLINNFVVEILLSLDDEFIYRKRINNYLDFSDLNHLAIKALEDTVDNKKQYTEATKYYQNLFLEIYVDEYQDNNDLQEYILNIIRGENVNFFRVGDVKQAIYGFRGSSPELFEEKYISYTKISDLISDEQYNFHKDYEFIRNDLGICIVLKENFRSDENILKTSNYIFNRLMYKKNAGVSYDKDSALYYPSVKSKSNINPTYIISSDSDNDLKSNDVIEKIALEIKKQHSEKNIPYNNFAILLRSNSNMESYKDIFKNHNIPIYYKDKKGFINSHSFNLLFNLLRFINNQSYDVCLLVLLKSDIFKFDNNDLILLTQEEGETLYDKLLNSKLEKSKIAVNMLKRWINYSYNNSIYNLIKTINWDINFVEYMKIINLDDIEVDYFYNFLELVREIEDSNFNLSYVVEKLIEIKQSGEYEVEITPPENCVLMSSIHISKGLEYSVVFVVDLDKDFNLKDFDSKFLFSKELGITFNTKYLTEENSANILQKLYNINSSIQKKKSIQEEIRILYVALTRAKNELYLASSKELALGIENSNSENANEKEQVLAKIKNSKNYYEMLLPIMNDYDINKANNFIDKTERDAIFEKFNVENNEIETDKVLEEPVIEYEFDEEIDYKFLNNKPYVKEYFYPAKTSYSNIRKINNEKNIEKNKKEDLLLKTFSKLKNSKDALIRGNLIHKLFEKIVKDICNNIEIGNIIEYINKITQVNNVVRNINEERIITEEESEMLLNEEDIEKISEFVHIIKPILKNSDFVETEIMFTNMEKVKDLFENTNVENTTILQGVIDLLIKKDNEYIIIDYKTDTITKKITIEVLIERHKKQLQLYKNAVKNYYKQAKVISIYIYSYNLGKLIKIN